MEAGVPSIGGASGMVGVTTSVSIWTGVGVSGGGSILDMAGVAMSAVNCSGSDIPGSEGGGD